MRIDPGRCLQCASCVPYCPAGAIQQVAGAVAVDEQRCFDCGLCQRQIVCAQQAFVASTAADELPRSVRGYFSNPRAVHASTGIPGRGTDETKTNDVSGRIRRGELAVLVELGRPGLGATFVDVALLVSTLRALQVEFVVDNPLVALLDDDGMPSQLMGERILSCILEVKVSFARLAEIVEALQRVAHRIDTVFSLSIACRFDDQGQLPLLQALDELGLQAGASAKINFGLGRPLAGEGR